MSREILALNKTYWCTFCNQEHRTATELGVKHVVYDEDYVITKSEWKKMNKEEIREHLKDLKILHYKALAMKEKADKERERAKQLKAKHKKVEIERTKYKKLVDLFLQTKPTRLLSSYPSQQTSMGVYAIVPEEDIYDIINDNIEFISKLSADSPILRSNGKKQPGYYLVVKRNEIARGSVVKGIEIFHHGIIR